MRRFDILQLITDPRKYAGHILDICKTYNTVDNLTKLLESEITEKELQTLMSIAQNDDYPLSFESKQ